jgi:hypothetical protein
VDPQPPAQDDARERVGEGDGPDTIRLEARCLLLPNAPSDVPKVYRGQGTFLPENRDHFFYKLLHPIMDLADVVLPVPVHVQCEM